MSCVHHSIEGTEKRSEQICLKTVQNVHNVSLTVYCEQDRLSLVMGGLVRGGKVTRQVTVESEVRLIYFDTWSTWKMPSRQIPTGHGRLDVCKSVYLFKHTPSHTLSTISTITQMSHKHPVFEGQMSSKENAEKSHELALRRDTTLSLSQKKIACGAGLQRLYEASAFKWLFKTCSQLFPQKPVLNTFTTCLRLFPPCYGVHFTRLLGLPWHYLKKF